MQAKNSKDAKKRERTESCAEDILKNVQPFLWDLRQFMSKQLARALSLSQYRALVYIEAFPKASLSDVADNLGATLPTTSRIISDLCEKKLITRKECSNDRRNLCLHLTPLGQSTREKAYSISKERTMAALGMLTAEEQETLSEGMRLLRKAFSSNSEMSESSQEPIKENGKGRR